MLSVSYVPITMPGPESKVSITGLDPRIPNFEEKLQAVPTIEPWPWVSLTVSYPAVTNHSCFPLSELVFPSVKGELSLSDPQSCTFS